MEPTCYIVLNKYQILILTDYVGRVMNIKHPDIKNYQIITKSTFEQDLKKHTPKYIYTIRYRHYEY